MSNMARFMKAVDADGGLSQLPTPALAALVDGFEAGDQAELRLAHGAMCIELGRRYQREAEATVSAAIVAALEPIADLRADVAESARVLREAYLDALTYRHPEARAAEEAWEELEEECEEFERGPVVPVIAAVRALLAQA